MSISLINQILHTYGYLAVFLFVAIESTGIPFPGETMLLTAGAYAGAGNLDIKFVILAAIAGAILGDNLGFIAGRTMGRDLVVRYGKYIRVDAAKLKTAENFFARHGDKTVFLGRFVALLRAWAAFLAGLNRMPWAKFLFFNAAGGICWAVLYGILAFELGRNLDILDKAVKYVGYAGIAVIVIAAIGFYLWQRHMRMSRPDNSSSQDVDVKATSERDGAPTS